MGHHKMDSLPVIFPPLIKKKKILIYFKLFLSIGETKSTWKFIDKVKSKFGAIPY